jgi:hypothetical protein
MEDLSLHILDVVENSITAGAREVGILIDEDNAENRLSLEITDNGKGMDEEMRSKVLDPFFTTRTTRRVGLGLPLLAEAARQSGGGLELDSAPGRGTTVRAVFQIGHPDLKPLGDVASTLGAILAGRPELELKFVHRLDGEIVASLDSTLSEAKRSE